MFRNAFLLRNKNKGLLSFNYITENSEKYYSETVLHIDINLTEKIGNDMYYVNSVMNIVISYPSIQITLCSSAYRDERSEVQPVTSNGQLQAHDR